MCNHFKRKTPDVASTPMNIGIWGGKSTLRGTQINIEGSIMDGGFNSSGSGTNVFLFVGYVGYVGNFFVEAFDQLMRTCLTQRPT
jgi:hypothetical protein